MSLGSQLTSGHSLVARPLNWSSGEKRKHSEIHNTNGTSKKDTFGTSCFVLCREVVLFHVEAIFYRVCIQEYFGCRLLGCLSSLEYVYNSNLKAIVGSL